MSKSVELYLDSRLGYRRSCQLRSALWWRGHPLPVILIRLGGLLAPSSRRSDRLCRWWLRPLASGTQAELLGEFGAGGGVVGGHHRIVMSQAPLGPILVGGEVEGGAQMPPEALQPSP